MRPLILVFAFLFVMDSFGFTLTNSPPIKFTSMEVTVNVSSDSCSGAGMTNSALLDMVEEAFEEYWNRVSTSALEVKKGSVVSTTLNSSTTLNAAAIQASPGTIIVGCSTNATLFPSPADDNTLGKGGIGSYSDGIKGAFLVNANGNFINQSASQKTAVIAHELGHSLGLGHSSDPIALMYYSVGSKVQERLTMDDKDGLTYLYPNEDSVPASCGSISYDGDSGSGNLLFTSLFFILLLSLAKKIQFSYDRLLRFESR
jgi:hypothetical protein